MKWKWDKKSLEIIHLLSRINVFLAVLSSQLSRVFKVTKTIQPKTFKVTNVDVDNLFCVTRAVQISQEMYIERNEKVSKSVRIKERQSELFFLVDATLISHSIKSEQQNWIWYIKNSSDGWVKLCAFRAGRVRNFFSSEIWDNEWAECRWWRFRGFKFKLKSIVVLKCENHRENEKKTLKLFTSWSLRVVNFWSLILFFCKINISATNLLQI